MNLKKQVILAVGILIVGITIGGISIHFFSTNDKHNHTGEAMASMEEGEQLYTCGMHPNVISKEPGNCPICGMKLTPVKGSGKSARKAGSSGKILYWRAPMDPTYISDKPGKSPMGMDLVPVYEGEEGGGTGSILIDPATEQNMGIRTAVVKRQDVYRTIRTVGTVTYNEEKLYTVNSKISGWIENLNVNYTGQLVRKGEPLLEIYSPDLVSAQEEYLLALKNRDMMKESSFDEIKNGAQTLLVSTRKRLENWDIPDKAIDAIEQRGAVTKTMTLTAPANGVVIHKNAVEGVHVKAGENLYQIADLSSVWVEASVYEYEVPWVKLGQPAEMELSYSPGKKFNGKVAYIYPYLDKKARDVKVRLAFANPKMELKPEMYANITIQTEPEHDVLVVPGQAVIRSGVRNVVFVKHDAGKFEPREITLGAEAENGLIKVASGLLEGEQIVTSGQFLLDSESNAQEAIRKMLEAKEQMTDGMGTEKKEIQHDHEKAAMNQEKHAPEMKMDNNEHTHAEGKQMALYTCPMHPEFVTDNPDQRCPECEMKLVKKKDLAEGTDLYTCPMHPEFVSDDPDARCSLCEMKLVKKD
ncbi:efflux RND transporter periplasmic adaptor subunit [candidate division KSB1 bacterium]|nr:efflux RND transporter periplasmic adaptor subunit [candidate division KSB1 bacterium]